MTEEIKDVSGIPVTFRVWAGGDGKHLIYALRDPRTNEAFYIGRTRKLRARMRSHIRLAMMPYRGKNRVYDFMNGVLSQGNGFICDIVGRARTEGKASECEKKAMCLVKYFQIAPLSNIAI